MCQRVGTGKGQAIVSIALCLLRVVDAEFHRVFRAGKELNKTGAQSTQRPWGVFEAGG